MCPGLQSSCDVGRVPLVCVRGGLGLSVAVSEFVWQDLGPLGSISLHVVVVRLDVLYKHGSQLGDVLCDAVMRLGCVCLSVWYVLLSSCE